MAGASQKKIAANNTKALKEIHILSGIVNLVAIGCIFYFHRPVNYKPFLLLSIPLIVSQVIIERSGRPTYLAEGRLLRAGEDLAQAGLTEYFFDVIYFTLIEDLLMVVSGSNKVWWLYVMIPGFAGYKLFGLLKYGKSLLGIGGGAPQVSQESEPEATTSKRQTKLQARGGKKKIIR